MNMSNKKRADNKTQLQFDENHYDVALQDFEAEFISDVDWTTPEEIAGEVMNQCWPSIVKIAREGFKKHGLGFVRINVKCYSAALVYDITMPEEAEAEYVTPGSKQDNYFQGNMPDYDPKKELVIVFEYWEGFVVGTAKIQRRSTRQFSKAA